MRKQEENDKRENRTETEKIYAEIPAAVPQNEWEERKMMKTIHDYTVSLAQKMEKSRLDEYTELLFNPRRLIWVNLMGGIARGVGVAIGVTLFTALIAYILQLLGALNLPIIGDFIADLVRIVQRQLDTKMY
ncbi:DUF5665 domain-containing protein [Paenibacillus popilliae]|uniref:Signal transduction histidine kinase n=1 Tax=Paenibacillus popilliae ATCC 14706 TaxID=1212764 RepID=M9LAX3_PAEPP|nr:DUF5665 domain-containing protein [Paenibacillus popilliae]GAC42897.1 signal transduction histidine kinase [Paenibacillus popilliae ATCC 14706]